jgi:hypothetical protein
MRDRARVHLSVGTNTRHLGDRHHQWEAVLFAFVTAAFPGYVSADTLQLVWDRSLDSVQGYVVHVGLQPGVYTQTVDVGNTDSFRMSSIQPGQQYCFAVTSYRGNFASELSNEACGYSNMYPSLTAPGDQRTIAGTPASLQLAGRDPMGDLLTYSATGLPAGLTVRADSGFISGTPTSAGSYTVTATVSDGVLSASQTFTWFIAATIGSGATPTSSAATSTRSLHKPTARATYTGTVARPRNVSAATSSTTATRGTSDTTQSAARDIPARDIASRRVVSAGSNATRAATPARAGAEGGADAACRLRDSSITRDATADGRPDVHVAILTPVHHAILSTSVLLWGRVEGTDVGGLDSTIIWTSNRDGRLGTGPRIVTSLRRGPHIITASVVPETGPTVRTSISVNVGGNPVD